MTLHCIALAHANQLSLERL